MAAIEILHLRVCFIAVPIRTAKDRSTVAGTVRQSCELGRDLLTSFPNSTAHHALFK
jgi:hypothetical protein